MRKHNKLMVLFLALTIVLSTAIVAFAEEAKPEERPMETGFYVKGAEGGENLFIDIYTYLNGDYNQLITNAGNGNVLFVHQSGKGATLENILNADKIEDALKYLTKDDFEDVYEDVESKEEFKPIVLGYTLEARLDKEDAKYKVDDEIIVTGKAGFKDTGLSGIDITMMIKDGNGCIITVEQDKTDENGEFSITFNLPEGTEAGEYTLTVKANEPVNKSIEKNFKIVDPVAEAKVAFMAALQEKAKDIEVAKAAIDEDDITVTFEAPEEGEVAEFIKEVQEVAEQVFGSLKNEVDAGTITFTIDDETGEPIDLKIATATEIAEALLGGKLEKAIEFLNGETPIEADYVANLTKDEVAFKLEGKLKFEVKKAE